jgi:hypothetical protein
MPTMKRAVLVCALAGSLAGSAGCVTTAGFVKHQDVSIAVLIAATAADLVVTSLAASQIQQYSYAGSIATGLAFTAVDIAVGCLTGACSALHL